MDELYQMIIFALKHYDNWKDRTHLRKVDLAPSKNISSLSYTKSMGLSLSPPQLLLPSSLIPPALSSHCSCPKSLQPSQKGKGLPFHENWEIIIILIMPCGTQYWMYGTQTSLFQ